MRRWKVLEGCHTLTEGGDCTDPRRVWVRARVRAGYRMVFDCEDHWVGTEVVAVGKVALDQRMQKAADHSEVDTAVLGCERLVLLAMHEDFEERRRFTWWSTIRARSIEPTRCLLPGCLLRRVASAIAILRLALSTILRL